MNRKKRKAEKMKMKRKGMYKIPWDSEIIINGRYTAREMIKMGYTYWTYVK